MFSSQNQSEIEFQQALQKIELPGYIIQIIASLNIQLYFIMNEQFIPYKTQQQCEITQFQALLLPHTENKLYQSCFTDVPSDSDKKMQHSQKVKLSSSRFFYSDYPSVQDRRVLVPLLDANGIQNGKENIKIMIQNYRCISQSDRLDLLNLEQQGNKKIEYQALSHYMSVWLLAMGYMTQKNKKYILGRLLMHLGKDGVKKGNYLYNNLFKSKIVSNTQRLEYLIGLCKNGWEYFISTTIKIIKEQAKIQKGEKN